MRRSLLLFTLLFALGGTAFADDAQPTDGAQPLEAAQPLKNAQPQWLLNIDGSYGVATHPATLDGDSVWGAREGLEWMPDQCPCQNLGFDLDANYLLVGPSSDRASDKNAEAGLRWLSPFMGPFRVTLLGGLGYNFTPNADTGHYLGFLEPGFRVIVAPNEALDFGIQYLGTSPKNTLPQALGVVLGLSIPLDGVYLLDSL